MNNLHSYKSVWSRIPEQCAEVKAALEDRSKGWSQAKGQKLKGPESFFSTGVCWLIYNFVWLYVAYQDNIMSADSVEPVGHVYYLMLRPCLFSRKDPSIRYPKRFSS